MKEILDIISSEQLINRYRKVALGEHTIDFIDRLKLEDKVKDNLVHEAMDIFSKCVESGSNENITNIAIGYVQSGKTLSFTTLTALAADNNYKVVIYFTGTKTNLQQQTFDRLAGDLNVKKDKYRLVKDYTEFPKSEYLRIPYFLRSTETVLLFPILKHYQHINNLAKLFADVYVRDALGNNGVLIIDDEADQSSFNTFARENATKSEDWDYSDKFSQTYASILNLRKALPCHSYVQYTATPQAAFLISNADILSPKFHTVLTPGDDYIGGKYFFKSENGPKHICIIPEDEIYHSKRNPLTKVPKSLLKALHEFFISVAIDVHIENKVPFLSMMVHADGLKAANESFHAWIIKERNFGLSALSSPDNDPARIEYLRELRPAYDSITKLMNNPPSFDEVVSQLQLAMLMTDVHLVQGKVESGYDEEAKNTIQWDEAQAHILVGADMLNRGFTVENLSMTYMCRATKGKSNADTIEQRCRFFGYKMKYLDVCRIYLPEKSIQEYRAYVDHEEIMRTALRNCNSLDEFARKSKALILDGMLNPTRTNILSAKLIRSKMMGWRHMKSIDCIDENKSLVRKLLFDTNIHFELYKDYNNAMRNHRYARISIDDFIAFFSKYKFLDVPNITRKIVTIQYLCYLKEIKGLDYVYVIEMGYNGAARRRKIDDYGPVELFMGYSKNESYPGDRAIKFDDSLCIQIHHLQANGVNMKLGNKDFYNLAIYYPDKEDYICMESDEDEDDEE